MFYLIQTLCPKMEDISYKELAIENFELHNDGPLTRWKKFEDVDIMVVTALGMFDDELGDLSTLLMTLPITGVPLPKRTRKVKKIPLPFPGEENVIMTASLGDKTRGIVRSEDSQGWPHAVMIDISTSTKNINCKITRSNVHMTGCKSPAMARECTLLVIKQINEINRMLQVFTHTLENNLPLIDEIFEQTLVDCTEGEDFNVFNIRSREDDTQEVDLIRRLIYNVLSDRTNVTKVEHAVELLEWLRTAQPFTFRKFELEEVDVSMVRRRFSLGENLNMHKLIQYGDKGFCKDYHSLVRSYAKFEIKCQLQVPGKLKKTTFKIDPNGQVTMSTSVDEEAEEMYYRFISMMFDIIDMIKI